LSSDASIVSTTFDVLISGEAFMDKKLEEF
jgi:hypothetical protein